MSSEAFRIGPLAIHWYGILAACGFMAAFWTASRRSELAGVSRDTVLDLMPWLMVGAIVGARAYYVAAYWEESFAGGPWWEFLMIRKGGLVWYGGLIGASLAVILYARFRRVALWKLADVMAPSIALGHVFGRIGCFTHGCCYGKACSLPWAVHFPETHATGGIGVHPTQLYESALNLGLYAALAWWFRRRRFDGEVFAIYLMGYAPVRIFVEIFRGDYDASQRYFGGRLAPGQLVSVVILMIGLALYATLRNSGIRPAPAKSAAG